MQIIFICLLWVCACDVFLVYLFIYLYFFLLSCFASSAINVILLIKKRIKHFRNGPHTQSQPAHFKSIKKFIYVKISLVFYHVLVFFTKKKTEWQKRREKAWWNKSVCVHWNESGIKSQTCLWPHLEPCCRIINRCFVFCFVCETITI